MKVYVVTCEVGSIMTEIMSYGFLNINARILVTNVLVYSVCHH